MLVKTSPAEVRDMVQSGFSGGELLSRNWRPAACRYKKLSPIYAPQCQLNAPFSVSSHPSLVSHMAHPFSPSLSMTIATAL